MKIIGLPENVYVMGDTDKAGLIQIVHAKNGTAVTLIVAQCSPGEPRPFKVAGIKKNLTGKQISELAWWLAERDGPV